MFHFPEGMRKSFMPNTTKWFEKLMTTPEAVKAYGRTVLCKNPLKPFTGKVNRAPLVFAKNEKNEKKEKIKEKIKIKENKIKIKERENKIKIKERENKIKINLQKRKNLLKK